MTMGNIATLKMSFAALFLANQKNLARFQNQKNIHYYFLNN